MALVSVSINHPEIKLSFVYLLPMTNATHSNFIVYIGHFCNIHSFNVPVTVNVSHSMQCEAGHEHESMKLNAKDKDQRLKLFKTTLI